MSDSEPMQPNDERELTPGRDDFFESGGFSKWAKWIIAVFAVMTLAAIAVPLIAAYTDWI